MLSVNTLLREYSLAYIGELDPYYIMTNSQLLFFSKPTFHKFATSSYFSRNGSQATPSIFTR